MENRRDSTEVNECVNCGNLFHGNFCNRCGQKTINRFTGVYLWEQLREDVIGLESGLVHTFKELWINPGKLISNYVKGATKQYYSPLKYLVFWTAVYLISVQFLNRAEQNPNFLHDLLLHTNKPFSSEAFADFNLFFRWLMEQKSDFYFLGIIPFLSASGYIFFRNKNFNVTEIVIFFTYFYGQFAFCAMAVNLADLIPAWSELKFSSPIILILFSLVFFRMIKQFFNESWKVSILKGVGILLVGTATFWFLLFLVFNGIKYLVLLLG
jgi:hypothetical protein